MRKALQTGEGLRKGALCAGHRGDGEEAVDDADMYAPPPPLEGAKILLTIAAAGQYARRTKRVSRSDDMVVMHIDVHRAYFHTKVDKDTFVELLLGDMSADGNKQCGKLTNAMYEGKPSPSAGSTETSATGELEAGPAVVVRPSSWRQQQD